MWLILGATVGAAALVNRVKEAALHPALAERVQVDGISVSLPEGWVNLDHEGETDEILRRDPRTGDLVIIAVRQLGFDEIYGMTQRSRGSQPMFLDEIELGGAPARLMIDRVTIGRVQGIPALVAARRLPQLREITITFLAPAADKRPSLSREVDLIKRIAASVEVDPNF